MRLRVLGSAAGGGSPQWNCGCANCAAVRAGHATIAPRTQASAAVSGDGRQWFLLNVSPDIRAQIESFHALHPRRLRDTPIGGAVLTNGDVDACLGLFILREDQPLVLYASEAVERGLREHNALTRTLERRPGQLTWTRLRAGEVVPLVGTAGPSGLTIEPVAVPGTVPLHMKGLVPASPDDNLALVLRDAHGHSIVYAPTTAAPTALLDERARSADAILFDGTFFRDDELTSLGLTTRSARDMAHWPLGGPEGSLRWLADLPCRRKILTHINNSNPILRSDAPEREALAVAGVEVGFDGLEVEL
ncbi:MAG TPA: pyrroloquinoline quinone biosynthesis protein PqqB [Kofleriaceae bacterium]|nr:pyrroloquinoline quinone biosynthesis protein PqqB [Kofleriaceae bacterium]